MGKSSPLRAIKMHQTQSQVWLMRSNWKYFSCFIGSLFLCSIVKQQLEMHLLPDLVLLGTAFYVVKGRITSGNEDTHSGGDISDSKWKFRTGKRRRFWHSMQEEFGSSRRFWITIHCTACRIIIICCHYDLMTVVVIKEKKWISKLNHSMSPLNSRKKICTSSSRFNQMLKDLLFSITRQPD